jgi:hypothetical protein
VEEFSEIVIRSQQWLCCCTMLTEFAQILNEELIWIPIKLLPLIKWSIIDTWLHLWKDLSIESEFFISLTIISTFCSVMCDVQIL